MIRHSVIFKLKYADNTPQAKTFFERAALLSQIKGVQGFEILRQVSDKNAFDFGLSMTFASQADYDAYNQDPRHIEFVQQIWLELVDEFMEIDYQFYRET